MTEPRDDQQPEDGPKTDPIPPDQEPPEVEQQPDAEPEDEGA